jgi:hypothetical protein
VKPFVDVTRLIQVLHLVGNCHSDTF